MRNIFVTLLVLFTPLMLPARADAPPGRYVVHADGTVEDTKTQLTWQQSYDTVTHTQASSREVCAGLELAGGGWRLPLRSELVTLTDPTLINPAIDPLAFPDTPPLFFWSSSVYAGDANEGWNVMFLDGNSGTAPVTTHFHVRCVR